MKRKLKQLDRDMARAANYAEWREAGREHDRLSGADGWKAEDASPHYDYLLIRRRLTQIRDARRTGKVRDLVFHLHEGLHGNLGNLSDPLLYQHCKVGTKYLIEEYLDEVCAALNELCDQDDPALPFEDKLAFFETTGSAFGQSALMLSGGAALGLFHIGVCKALWEQQLLPQVISGSSAGSIIAAVVGTHSDDALAEKLRPENLYLNAFRYVGWRGLLRGTPFLDGDHLEACLDENIPDLTFEEAYRLTGREINIPVSPYDRHQHARLLNWRTSPNVLIRKASRASCAIPGVYPAVSLWAKNVDGEKVPYIPGRKFVDGSIKDDLPIKRLARLYGINHSIVSQTNPHVVPFLSRNADTRRTLPVLTDWLVRNAAMNAGYGLDLLIRRVGSNDVALVLDKARSVLSQNYIGDINLIPPRRPLGLLRVLANPSVDDVRRYVRLGEQVSWPQMSRIHNTTRISRTFRDCNARLAQIKARRLKRAHLSLVPAGATS
ncbi:DUF3336 domain-containing protein [Isoalcanivorax beigongshangi]|uniref:DUF3336 domain-containing protein n=1 Tax=Isoalcanivorax beigongshangi TaxID=3238810 RepID=A0ABV4AGM7_9GAMM